MVTRKCETCKGKGEIRRSGYDLDCDDCDGTGYYHYARTVRCQTCNGKKTLSSGCRCFRCGGHGKLIQGGGPGKAPNSGGCYITTATMKSLQKKDDCKELMTFRHFRDSYLMPRYPEEVKKYYEEAPRIVEKLNLRPDSEYFYHLLWRDSLSKAYDAILKGENEAAYSIYRTKMEELSQML